MKTAINRKPSLLVKLVDWEVNFLEGKTIDPHYEESKTKWAFKF